MLNWSLNFIAQLNVQGPALGLTPDQIMTYGEVQSLYANAYAVATKPETRGGATILAKNQAKKALIAKSRELAMVVANNPAVTDQQRYDCGLTVRDSDPTPVPPPSTAPDMDLVSVTGHTVRLRLHAGDSAARRKPTGVQGATLFSHVGDQPPADLTAWKFEGSTTKTEIDVVMPATVPSGSKVWFTAFWFNRRSQSGPACTPMSAHVGFGGVGGLAAAA